jgi:hypothetical protein
VARSPHAAGRVMTTHGMRGTPTYKSYLSAKARCQNPNNDAYDDYGARGIQFRYVNFEQFFADMGFKPEGLTLERRNNNGHYEPGNCIWATYIEQNNNRRSNRLIIAFGRTQTLAQWVREVGFSRNTIRSRIDRNFWSPEDALTRPAQQRRISANQPILKEAS